MLNIINHDASSVYIELDVVEDEVEAMKRYVESITEDIRKIKEDQKANAHKE